MEDIFVKQNKDKNKITRNENGSEKKELTKQISAVNITVKNSYILENIDKEIKDDNKNKSIFKEVKNEKGKEKHEKHKEYKLLFNKKNDNVINKFSFKQNNNENNEIYNLKDIYNNSINNNYNIFKSIKEKKNKKENVDASLTNKEKNKKKDILDEILLINSSQKNDNFNQYLLNNLKYNNNKNKLSNSNLSINLLPNDLFSNIKGYYYKKMINSKILTKKSSKIKNKSNNSLNGSNSARTLNKNVQNINENFSNQSKKNFLKKELFNGTFYPNKSTKYFIISNTNNLQKKRKASASLINKKMDLSNNKKLASSSSSNDLFHSKNDKNENREFKNLSDFFSKIDFGSSPDITKRKINDNIDKKLPFINLIVNAKKANIFRNNLHLVNKNNNTNKKYTKNNGFFSERMKKNEITKLNFK
jgi:hypothetical protein